MEMIIHLDSDIFDLVNNGTKTIEGRVNDEKRRKLSIGDRLIFVNREDDNNIIESIVEDLIYFNNFEEMVEKFDIKYLYKESYTKNDYLDLIKRFYKDEEIKKNGVVAIIFKKKI